MFVYFYPISRVLCILNEVIQIRTLTYDINIFAINSENTEITLLDSPVFKLL